MLIELINLTVSYGQKIVLNNLNLQLERGAVGLLGPNGAGKSTLIKTLLGFVPPTTGYVHLFGKKFNPQKAEIRQQIGYMPENDSYIPGVSAVSFVSYAGELCGMSRKDAKQRAHEVLNYVGIGEIRYRPIETYVSGLRQRLKLAQALVHDPTLLLLDEPTNGMDQKGREVMLSLITDLVVEQKIDIIFSSHILNDIESTCTSVLILNDGEIAFNGKLKSLREKQLTIYDIGLKGDIKRFMFVLEQQGFNCEKISEVSILVTPNQHMFNSTEGFDNICHQFFQLALEAETQIRHVRLVKPSLGDFFHQQLAISSPLN